MPIFDMLERHLSSKLAQQKKRSSGPYSYNLVKRSTSIGSSAILISIDPTCVSAVVPVKLVNLLYKYTINSLITVVKLKVLEGKLGATKHSVGKEN
jgi:hypothetical protein